MKTKIIILLFGIVFTNLFSKNIAAQKVQLKGLVAEKTIEVSPKKETVDIDKNLVIVNPSHGKNVTGKLKITGRANPNSSIKIDVTASYYKYTPDYKKNKLNKGEGPFDTKVKNIILKTDASGNWITTPVNFNNYGFSTTFKIVAKSVEHKNITYVLVENNKLPNIAWD
jgi:hypothetical protein